MKIRVGIVGSGLIAQIMHIPYIKEIEKYELTAICDAIPGLVKTVGKAFSVPRTYTDHAEMLRKESLDAVVVCSSTEHHDRVSIDASEAGCHVLVEKPMTLSIKAADEMIAAAKKADRKLMVAYMKRYDPGYEAGAAMMKEVQDDVVLIRAHDFPNFYGSKSRDSISAVLDEMTKRHPIPPEKQEESKKRIEELLTQQLGEYSKEEMNVWMISLLGLGSHDMTVLRGAFGEPKEVLAASIIPGVASESEMETSYTTKILAMLDYGKAKCTFEVGGTQRTWFDEELVAYGNKETISVRFPYPWIKNEPTIVTRTRMKNGGFEKSIVTSSYRESFKQEHIHFLNCIEEDIEPRTSGSEGKIDMQVLYDILKKARKNKSINVS